MEKLDIYCSRSFLDEWMKLRQAFNENPFENTDLNEVWGKYFNLLKKGRLRFDLDRDGLDSEYMSNPVLRIIHKQGTAKIEPARERFEEIRNGAFDFGKIHPASLFLLDEDLEKGGTAAQFHGMISLTKAEIRERARWLFEQAAREISKGEQIQGDQPWGFLRKFKRPINSMVIIDPYLFGSVGQSQGKALKKLKYNLSSILEELLPVTELSNGFHLTVFTYYSQPHENAMGLQIRRSNLESFHKEVQEIVRSLERPYNVNLSIVSTNHDSRPHDRHIITNNYWLFSGLGFNLFDRNRSVQASHILMHSVAAQDGQSMFEKLKKTMSAVASGTKISLSKDSGGHLYIGKKPFRNRLIEAYF
jgi:hypothetical protein